MITFHLKKFFLFLLLIQQVVFANPLDKIVGGEKAAEGQFPWVVYLIEDSNTSRPVCGGVLIEKNKVLTAAHCLIGNPIAIVAGRIKRSQTRTGQIIKIKSIIQHPKYDNDTIDYDVATLILENDVKDIEPIKLHKSPVTVNGTPLITMGWGVTTPQKLRSLKRYSIGNSDSNDLMYVEVPLKEYTACKTAMKPNNVTERMLCAGPDQGGKDACQGDSGGPIIINNNNQWELVGLVSWGMGCARAGKYGVYTNLFATSYPEGN